MNLILFDGVEADQLLPLTFTRPVSEIRVGILTIREKWERLLETKAKFLTKNYLSKKFPLKIAGNNLLVNGSVCPSLSLMSKIIDLKSGEGLYKGDTLIACNLIDADVPDYDEKVKVKIQFEGQFTHIDKLWKIFLSNEKELNADFTLLADGRTSQNISSSNTLIGDQIFVEKGAEIEGAILNAKTGPIYVGKNAKILEGAMIRNGLALCESSVVKMGAKIYGTTTVGPHSKVGGEVSNSVLFGYSNKGHDGYLGNSVLGEWCNLGADTNNSNLKNNYDQVKLWSYNRGGFERTGETFCGLIMGDHSKCGINTMFNTGTVVGVSANIFGAGFPRNFIPSFSWGGAQGYSVYQLNKAFKTAEIVYGRRGLDFNEMEQDILAEVFKRTEQFRNF
jgi:UDP-N-acetylglucosamine diphosphorylase/glucosamine-1-phosphate N-acetyltransferase